jgi:uncharacterized protein YdaU (DUF1376 family)
MTTREFGAYILLMCKAWHEDPPCSIPSTDRVLARWARLSPEEWGECKAAVLIGFTNRPDGRLYHEELEREFQKSRAITRRKSQAGKAAVEARWKKDGRKPNGDTQLDTGVLRTHSERTANELPIDTISQPQPQPHKTPPNPPAGGIGVCGNRGERAGRKPSPLAGLVVDDLRDTGRLRERIVALVSAGTVPNTENDRLMCVAAAERALEIGENPVALWINLVRTKRWSVISAEEVDRAKNRIAAWLADNRPPLPPVVTGLGDRLSGSTDDQPPDEDPRLTETDHDTETGEQ